MAYSLEEPSFDVTQCLKENTVSVLYFINDLLKAGVCYDHYNLNKVWKFLDSHKESDLFQFEIAINGAVQCENKVPVNVFSFNLTKLNLSDLVLELCVTILNYIIVCLDTSTYDFKNDFVSQILEPLVICCSTMRICNINMDKIDIPLMNFLGFLIDVLCNIDVEKICTKCDLYAATSTMLCIFNRDPKARMFIMELIHEKILKVVQYLKKTGTRLRSDTMESMAHFAVILETMLEVTSNSGFFTLFGTMPHLESQFSDQCGAFYSDFSKSISNILTYLPSTISNSLSRCIKMLNTLNVLQENNINMEVEE